MKSVLAAVGAVWCATACSTTDDRPEHLAYITETILAPSCAPSQCHSAMRRAKGYAFDTVELAQQSLSGVIGTRLLIGTCPSSPCNTSPTFVDDTSSYLLTVLEHQTLAGNRMPYDAPMPQVDIDLISNWIRDGADGYSQPSFP